MIELRFSAGHRGHPLVTVGPPHELLGMLLGLGYPPDRWLLTTLRDNMRAVLVGEREEYIDGEGDILVEVSRESVRVEFDAWNSCIIPTADCLDALERWRIHLEGLVRGVGRVWGVLRQPFGSLPAGTTWEAEVWLEQWTVDRFFARGELRSADGWVGQFGIEVNAGEAGESTVYERAMAAVMEDINRRRGRHGPASRKLMYRVTGSEWLSKGRAKPGAAPDTAG